MPDVFAALGQRSHVDVFTCAPISLPHAIVAALFDFSRDAKMLAYIGLSAKPPLGDAKHI